MSKPPSLFFKKPTLNLFVFFCIKNAKLTISAVFYLRICKQPENVIIRMLLWVDDSLSVFIPSANSILLAFLLINLQRLRKASYILQDISAGMDVCQKSITRHLRRYQSNDIGKQAYNFPNLSLIYTSTIIALGRKKKAKGGKFTNH